MSRIHEEKLSLCDALEAIADSLPGNVDRFECLRVGSVLAPAMRRSHQFEETRIFPAFERSPAVPGRAVSVARLKSEHLADECAAADVSEELLRIGHGEEIGNPEALGFMLRALFEAMRRHIAFEREHVMPAIRSN
ncbi:MAG: hemerythrin domain-containing protein [Mesorhizobium sp.]|nr:hemerythrin domain-containing protein [Mesorhizobium sp.]MCO5160620.1 hemerythrin domain-containing protein [Mesorhizobium sp.]